MMIRSNYQGGVEAICGFTTTGHGALSGLRMPWSVATKLRPGVQEVPL